MTIPNGSDQLDDDRRHILKRMAAALQRDLMRQDGIGPTMRAEVIERIERWIAESETVGKA